MVDGCLTRTSSRRHSRMPAASMARMYCWRSSSRSLEAARDSLDKVAREDQLSPCPFRQVAQIRTVRRRGSLRALHDRCLIERRHRSHHVYRHVNRARESGDFGRCQRAARVDPVRQDDDGFVGRRPGRQSPCGDGGGVVERRGSERAEIAQDVRETGDAGRKGLTLVKRRVERKYRHFVPSITKL